MRGSAYYSPQLRSYQNRDVALLIKMDLLELPTHNPVHGIDFLELGSRTVQFCQAHRRQVTRDVFEQTDHEFPMGLGMWHD